MICVSGACRTDPLSAAVFSAATSALTAARSAGELNDQSSAMRAKALRVQIEAIVSRTTEESQADRSGVRRVKRVRGGD